MSKMKTEYLISIENKDNICKTEQAFANLLMINGDIKIDKNIIEYKGKFYTYKIKKYINKNPKNLNENKQDQKQDQKQNKKQKKEKSKKKKTEFIYFHITIGAEIDESNQSDIKAYESLLRSIRVAIYKVTDKLQTIWDDVSFYYSRLAYPLIYDMENSMRKLLTKFMVVNVGRDWVKQNTPDRLANYITENKMEELFYKFNFLELRSYLFDERTMYDMKDLINENKDRGFVTINQIAPYLKKSNWDRYFDDFVDLDGEQLSKKWKELYVFRCKVAHNNKFLRADYEKVLEIFNEIKPQIDKAIESLDDVEVNEFEREVLSENFISMRNVKAGEFIIEFNRLHQLVNCLCTGIGIDIRRAPTLRMALRSLYNESIINEYELEELDNISKFRNYVVHGTQSIEEDKLEESFDKIRQWSAVIETKIGACRKEKIRALEIMEDVFKTSNVVRYDRANREKINEDNIYCVTHKSQGLLNEYTRMLSEITDEFELNDRDTFLGIKMLDNSMFGSLKPYLNSHSWEDLLNCYIIKLMNDCNGGVIEELNGKELDFYLEYIEEKDILELYRRLVDYQVKKSIGEMYGEDAVNGETTYDAEISILINNSDWMHYKYIVDCLQALKSIRAFLEENEIYIDIKIFMKDDGYITSHLLEEFESNILSLKWSKIEIRDSVLGALFEAMEELHERQISLFDRALTDDVDDSKKLSLFWGKNAVDGERDISMMDYFCENLERIGRFNVVDASRILVEAMEIEKSRDLDIMNGKVVSQGSLKTVFETYTST